MPARSNPEEFLDAAITAVAAGDSYRAHLDALPVPIYVTGADGAVIYWNSACVDLAGREPQLGQDRWCVTWQLYTTTGDPMPHDQCPMAKAIEGRKAIRDAVAIAARPDGSRVAFRAYPTPLFHADGSLRACVNMLIDVSEEQSEALQEQADRCRRLADATYDRATSKVLGDMAEGFDRTAAELKK